MGTWGPAAWDNDTAADWFADMFEKTKLAKYIEKQLKKDASEEPEEVRAAASVLVALGRTYVWPVDDLDRHLALAVKKLEEVKALYAEEFPDFKTTIDDEIAQLKAEMPKDGAG